MNARSARSDQRFACASGTSTHSFIGRPFMGSKGSTPVSARGATRSQMFGMPVLKAGDKVFAGTFGDAMTFKLGPDDLQQARATKVSASRSKRSTVFGPASGIVGVFGFVALVFFDAGFRSPDMVSDATPAGPSTALGRVVGPSSPRGWPHRDASARRSPERTEPQARPSAG